jgi:hypothetical protein
MFLSLHDVDITILDNFHHVFNYKTNISVTRFLPRVQLEPIQFSTLDRPVLCLRVFLPPSGDREYLYLVGTTEWVLYEVADKIQV